MRSRLILLLVAATLLTLAGPVEAHHGKGDHAPPPEDPKEPEPCACDPDPNPQPIDVVIGDGFECVGGYQGSFQVDGGAVRATVYYCYPGWIDRP